MADSIRETVLDAIMTALTGTANVSTRIYRARQDAITRDDAPAIVVRPLQDEPGQIVVNKIENKLRVGIEIYTRGAGPDALADPIAVSAYSKIMADPTFSGKAIDTIPVGTQWDMQSADQDACITTMLFDVWYRNTYADISAA